METAEERETEGGGMEQILLAIARPLTLAEALDGVGGPAGGTAEGPLEAVVLLGQLFNGFLQVDTLLLLILQCPLPFPAVCLS